MNRHRDREISVWLIHGYAGVCPNCGKRAFTSRKAAKL